MDRYEKWKERWRIKWESMTDTEKEAYQKKERDRKRLNYQQNKDAYNAQRRQRYKDNNKK